jgi:transglutaminase-like putative cysteine protease
MTIQIAIHHKTEYRYDRPVRLGPHVLRLRPAPHCRTPILSYSLKVEPAGHFINWQQDPFSNYLARLIMPDKTRTLAIDVDLIAELSVINPFDFFLDEAALNYPFSYEPRLAKDLAIYRDVTERGPALIEWVSTVDRSERPTVDFLVDLNQRVQREIAYTIRLEPGVQSGEETLTKRIGSCRDSAWLLVLILRQLRLAARFVSGYSVQLQPDQKALEGPPGPTEDFTDLHAWAEAYLPGAGWVGLDPTSGLFAGEGHIPLACAPDPEGAAPLTGGTDPCRVDFYYHNNVQRIHEDPRVTKPYGDADWEAIMRLGRDVDLDLASQDVRLTLGGEPTFVSIDDMEGAEWNTEALGPVKRDLAGQLMRRLKDRFAPGGLVQHGQGKWYPGEPLPRWALSLFWRADGHPVWSETDLLAVEGQDYGLESTQAAQFAAALASRLRLDPGCVLPGYEDIYYYLWREGTLPENVDPLQKSRIRWNAPACAACSKPASIRSWATRCRLVGILVAAGTASTGASGASGCISSRATRPWVCACR